MDNKPYIIISSASVTGVERLVNEHVEEGYKPIGGISISNGVFAQAMFKEKTFIFSKGHPGSP